MRVIGVVRQSQGSDDALSPADQRRRLDDYCDREGWDLVRVLEEIDVPGGTPLSRRDKMRGAVEDVEEGKVDVVLVAYFDRLVRSLTIQEEIVTRVESAGGRVYAVDFGQVTHATAAQWLSSTTVGMVSEYWKRSVGERLGNAQVEAIANGTPCWDSIPPGYRREIVGTNEKGNPVYTGPFLVDEAVAPLVVTAYEMRADETTIKAIRAYLADHGAERSYRGTQWMLGARVYLGELHFGSLQNLEAHEPIVDRGLWESVQRMRGTRAPRSKSDRLLARLGVLRCGSCGARMVVGTQTQNGRRYPFYRCPPVGMCTNRMAIGARFAEDFARDQAQAALDGRKGRASADRERRDAERALDVAQATLDAAIRAFGEFGTEPAALERLRELRDARDLARERVDHLGHLDSALEINATDDWDRMTLAARRGLVRATVAAIHVEPGRGPGRLTAELLV